MKKKNISQKRMPEESQESLKCEYPSTCREQISRRKFLSQSTVLGTSALAGTPLLIQASASTDNNATMNQNPEKRPKCKITVLRREFYQDLANQYLAHPNVGKCNLFQDGQEIIVDSSNFNSMINGRFCAEAWDCMSRYIYSALQGGSIMRGWTNDEKVMITCCNDGTRPVIFKLERIDE